MIAARDPRDVASMVPTTFMFLSYGNSRIKLLQLTFYRTIGNLAYQSAASVVAVSMLLFKLLLLLFLVISNSCV